MSCVTVLLSGVAFGVTGFRVDDGDTVIDGSGVGQGFAVDNQ